MGLFASPAQSNALNVFGASASGMAHIHVSAMIEIETIAASASLLSPILEARRSKTTAPTTARHSVVIIQNRAGTRSELNPGRYISSAYGPRYMSGLPISVGDGPKLNSHMTKPASA